MSIDNSQYKLMVEYSPSLIFRTGTNRLCDYFNKTWLDFTGRTLDQEYGTGWLKGVHPDDLADCTNQYANAFANGAAFEIIFRLKRHDGAWRWIDLCGVPFYDEERVFKGYNAHGRDISHRLAGEQARIMAQTDGLTGIMTREQFIRQATAEYERAERFKQNICIAMIDIDRYHEIENQFGKQIGEEVLRRFAKAIAGNVRKFDLVARYGGDEFIVMFANSDLDQAVMAMNRLSAKLQAPQVLSDEVSLGLSFSFGFAVPQQDEPLKALISLAGRTKNQMKRENKKS